MEGKAQFNLLPDLKLKSVKAQRTRRLVTSLAMVISLASLAAFGIMLLSVYVVQNKQLSDADKQIKNYTQQLNKNDNLDKIITVQNQLTTLSGLHKNKHATSRIFNYLPQLTPNNVTINNLSMDMTSSLMQIDGRADSQKSANTFIDTLKFTTYSLEDNGKAVTAFPSVVESNFAIGNNGANFSLSVSFDQSLFSNATTDSSGKPVTPKLNVPKQTTTRSALDDPSNVFNQGTR